MNSFATVIFLASTAFAYPQLYRSDYGTPQIVYSSLGSGNVYNPNPSNTGYQNNQFKRASAVSPTTNLNSATAKKSFGRSSLIYNQATGRFETAKVETKVPLVETSMDTNIPTLKSAMANTDFGSSTTKETNPAQGATYLPVMKAFLSVMKNGQPSTPEVNSLMVQIRDLNQKVPKEQNLMGDFFAILGLDNLDLLPASGDILVDVNGVRSVLTNWGMFPWSQSDLMTPEEKAEFLPVAKTFTNALKNGDQNESKSLEQQIEELTNSIPKRLTEGVQDLTGN